MKLLPIVIASLACLYFVSAVKNDKSVSSSDRLDIIDQSKNENPSPDAQRKRDTGYSYVRPNRFSSSARHEAIRGRIISKGPTSQTLRPFNRYGPPRQQQQQQLGAFQQSNKQQDLHVFVDEFSNVHGVRNSQQKVPNPLRDYEFIEPSPIAGQNNVPFNSNFANYLPPKNQKLPAHANPYSFANNHQPTRFPNDHSEQITRHRDHQQSLKSTQQNENFIREQSVNNPQQLSDAATFLSENSQAISQLYEAPATNLNYEPFHEGSHGISQNSNNHFQNFRPSESGAISVQDSHGFRGNLPSYASGFLERDALRNIKSLEKDRLITQLQHALVDAQGNRVTGDAGARYAQNHENPDYIHNQQSILGSHGQVNPSIGPQLDRPNNFNHQRPYGSTNQVAFTPIAASPVSGYTYVQPSPTPPTGPSSTTVVSSIETSSVTQRPHVIGSQATSQTGNSLLPPPSTSTTFQYPQHGGFVPSFVGTNYLTSYPAYATGVISSGSSNVNHVQSSAPTQFGIPIPTIPVAQTPTIPPFSQKPDSTISPGHQNPPVTPIHPIPLQPINSISATPIHPTFPLVPAVTQVHQIQTPATSGHSTYGIQQGVNPLLVKPIKTVYPLYYYQNFYQIQKPGWATLPWNYAPSYSQIRPEQAWK